MVNGPIDKREYRSTAATTVAKCLLHGMVAVYTLLVPGCRIVMPEGNRPGEPCTVEPQARISILYTQVKPDISESTRTVHLPHAESAAGKIGTYGTCGFGWGFGYAITAEEPFGWKLGAGIDGKLRLASSSYEQAFTHEQPSLSPSQNNIMSTYCMLSQPAWWSFEPFVGGSVSIRNVLVGLEYGFPSSTFDLEKGYFRNGDYHAFETSSWKGFGQSLTGRVGLKESGSFLLKNVSLTYRHEWYEPRLLENEERVTADSLFVTLEDGF